MSFVGVPARDPWQRIRARTEQVGGKCAKLRTAVGIERQHHCGHVAPQVHLILRPHPGDERLPEQSDLAIDVVAVFDRLSARSAKVEIQRVFAAGSDVVDELGGIFGLVLAAASYAARLLADGHGGAGIRTQADPPIATVQLFVEQTRNDAESAVRAAQTEIAALVDAAVATLVERGGGFRALAVQRIGDALKVEIDLDVRDAMGANKVNTAGEAARPLLERLTGGRLLMAIVTNASRRALVRAAGEVPCARLARGGYSGAEVAQRIVRAAAIAAADHDRAVTHNKGVLNGIAALTQATGNDTRAVEAAAHGWAAAGAGYAPLTGYHVANGALHCRLQCPLPLGTVGGAVGVHPVSRLALRILGNPDSRRLAAVAAAVGLAQNLPVCARR